MVRHEDYCVGCPTEKGCLGNACPNTNVPVYYCDECGTEVEELYKHDGEELCQDCLLEKFEKVSEE